MNCGNCGKQVRSCRLAYVYDDEGRGLVRKRCCAECQDLAVLIVVGTVKPRENGQAIALSPRERETRNVLRSLARYLRSVGKANEVMKRNLEFAWEGEVQQRTMDQAADIAEAWASRPEARQDYDDLAEEDTS
jgi:hypothetical protein